MRVELAQPFAAELQRGHVHNAVLGLRRLGWPLAATVLLVVIAAEDGGYYPTTWNWAALVVAWVAAAALSVRDSVTLSRLELVMIGALFALVGWVALSGFWTASVPSTVLEVQRDVLYVVVVLAAATAFGRASSRRLLGAVLVAITLVSWYALATRIFPDRAGTFDSISGYRLLRPFGYWNALGIFAAMGMLLALAFAARARHLAARVAASAALVVLAPTLYFTYSRGAWIALGLGLVAAIALDSRRLQLITTTFVVAAAPTVAVLFASQLRGLTHVNSSLDRATHDGHRLAAALLVLAVAAVALMWLQNRLETSLSVPRAARRAYVGVLVLALVAVLSLAVARYGSPAAMARTAWSQLSNPVATVGGTNLNSRLFSLSGNRKLIWEHAWSDARAHPVLGSGAGTFEIWYLRHRTDAFKVRDAHSLYLETLAELGPVGLTLLLLALLSPLVAAVRARRGPVTAVTAGAYAAFLLHAGVDWDWEVTAVTATGLLCGVALLIEGRREQSVLRLGPPRYALVAPAVAVAVFSIVGLLGNVPASNAGEAVRARDWTDARAEARKAIRWAPWSADGWRRLGQSEVGSSQPTAAVRDLKTAIRKDPQNWDRWFDLALATTGAEQRRALERALALNPRSPELAEFVAGVGLKGLRSSATEGG